MPNFVFQHLVRGIVAVVGLTVLASEQPASAAANSNTINYRGYRIQVPASWQVISLDKDPRQCVRFDRNVVYLGQPGDQQICPSSATGRTEALLIQPLTQTALAPNTAVVADSAAPSPLPNPTGHEISFAVPKAGVLVTASYGNFRSTIERALTSASVITRQYATAVPPKATPRTAVAVHTPGDFTGHGFDTCTAPPQHGMDAWLGSQYRAVGIYIGGISKACSQKHLTPEWIHRQTELGWRLLPIYVGLQAPCTAFRNKIDPLIAAQQGWADGEDAANQASWLGIGAGSTLYADMESFDPNNVECRDAVLGYLRFWIIRVHERGYATGVYSSAATGIRAIVTAPHFPRPDHIWFAHWDGIANAESRHISNDLWQRKRVKQFLGGHLESYSGWEINIDSNFAEVIR